MAALPPAVWFLLLLHGSLNLGYSATSSARVLPARCSPFHILELANSPRCNCQPRHTFVSITQATRGKAHGLCFPLCLHGMCLQFTTQLEPSVSPAEGGGFATSHPSRVCQCCGHCTEAHSLFSLGSGGTNPTGKLSGTYISPLSLIQRAHRCAWIVNLQQSERYF